MLPATLVGTVVTPGGPQPFVLDTATGNVTVGRYEAMNSHQANLAPDAEKAAMRQVERKVKGAREVRLGAYHCGSCGRWIQLATGGWSGEQCSTCAG